MDVSSVWYNQDAAILLSKPRLFQHASIDTGFTQFQCHCKICMANVFSIIIYVTNLQVRVHVNAGYKIRCILHPLPVNSMARQC